MCVYVSVRMCVRMFFFIFVCMCACTFPVPHMFILCLFQCSVHVINNVFVYVSMSLKVSPPGGLSRRLFPRTRLTSHTRLHYPSHLSNVRLTPAAPHLTSVSPLQLSHHTCLTSQTRLRYPCQLSKSYLTPVSPLKLAFVTHLPSQKPYHLSNSLSLPVPPLKLPPVLVSPLKFSARRYHVSIFSVSPVSPLKLPLVTCFTSQTLSSR